MKLCPKCQANVEGLVDHCDCCGASLNPRKSLFLCACYDLPECLGFASLSYHFLESIEPSEADRYSSFLEKVFVEMFCYPDSMIQRVNIRNRVYFSKKRKFARVSIVVPYDEFVYAGKKNKQTIVYHALYRGIQMLEKRLQKDKCDISELLKDAERIASTQSKPSK